MSNNKYMKTIIEGKCFASIQLIIILLGTGLSACTALGPTSAPNWREQVSAVVPRNDGGVDFLATSEWFPDTQGFMDMRGVGLLVPHTNFRQGVFALTPQSLLFLQWDSKSTQYAIMYRTSYADVMQAKVDSLGRNRRLVIFGKDYRAQSFGIYGPNGGLVDQEAMEHAYELVSARIPKP
jgi:hypothetical protein